MIDYSLIAGILLYFLVVKGVTSAGVRPLAASLITVLGYFALVSFIKWVILSAYGAPLGQLFGLVPLATLVVQFGVALLTFYMLDRADSYGALLIWGAVGCVGIFFIAPFVIASLLAGIAV